MLRPSVCLGYAGIYAATTPLGKFRIKYLIGHPKCSSTVGFCYCFLTVDLWGSMKVRVLALCGFTQNAFIYSKQVSYSIPQLARAMGRTTR